MRSYDILMMNVNTGEQWEAGVLAEDSAAALQKFLRRRRVAEHLANHPTHRWRFAVEEMMANY